MQFNRLIPALRPIRTTRKLSMRAVQRSRAMSRPTQQRRPGDRAEPRRKTSARHAVHRPRTLLLSVNDDMKSSCSMKFSGRYNSPSAYDSMTSNAIHLPIAPRPLAFTTCLRPSRAATTDGSRTHPAHVAINTPFCMCPGDPALRRVALGYGATTYAMKGFLTFSKARRLHQYSV